MPGAMVALQRKDGGVLLTRRADDGTWCLPAGAAEPSGSFACTEQNMVTAQRLARRHWNRTPVDRLAESMIWHGGEHTQALSLHSFEPADVPVGRRHHESMVR
jgi:NUDIX domain